MCVCTCVCVCVGDSEHIEQWSTDDHTDTCTSKRVCLCVWETMLPRHAERPLKLYALARCVRVCVQLWSLHWPGTGSATIRSLMGSLARQRRRAQRERETADVRDKETI